PLAGQWMRSFVRLDLPSLTARSPKRLFHLVFECPCWKMLWGGGVDIASIVRCEPMELPMQTLNNLSRSLIALEPASTFDSGHRDEPVELARCRYRAWHRASAVEEAGGRRERITEAAASMAGGSGESRMQDRTHCRCLRGRP